MVYFVLFYFSIIPVPKKLIEIACTKIKLFFVKITYKSFTNFALWVIRISCFSSLSTFLSLIRYFQHLFVLQLVILNLFLQCWIGCHFVWYYLFIILLTKYCLTLLVTSILSFLLDLSCCSFACVLFLILPFWFKFFYRSFISSFDCVNYY